MHIHTLSDGETVADVASRYGVCEDMLRANNSLEGCAPVSGEELLVLIPTRTYTVKHRDTPEKLSLRFGVTKRDLYAQNPRLYTRGLYEGDRIALKHSEPIYGMGVANGYFYKGCPISALERAMPYLTYITVASAVEQNGEIIHSFDSVEVVRRALENGKIPLLRIFRCSSTNHIDKEYVDKFCRSVIDAALNGGYRGVVLSECSDDSYGELLVELRGRMIGHDLILISEMSETSDNSANEYADGSILSYDKYAEEAPSSLRDGEERIYSDFACRAESSKTFISLPSMAKWGRGYCSVGEALRAARQYGCKIETDEKTLLSSYSSPHRGELCFTSLQNIRAVLGILAEYGYMGVSFDIMRTPISYLMMYGALFRTAHYACARAAEGCSRPRGENHSDI